MKALLTGIALFVVVSSPVLAQDPPSLQGTWKPTRAERDGRVALTPTSTLKITIEPNVVRFRYEQRNKKGKLSSQQLMYYTDGKPFNSPKMRLGAYWIMTARWEREGLVATSKPPDSYRDMTGGKLTSEEVWSLSRDGSELTRTLTTRNAYACEGNPVTSLGPCRTRDIRSITVYRRE